MARAAKAPGFGNSARMRKGRNRGRWLLALAVGAVYIFGWIEGAGAACVAPELEVRPASVEPGGSVTVTGTGFITECNDVITPNEPPPPPSPPETGIEIAFVQGDDIDVLATVSADASYRFIVTVIVPADATAGEATVRAVGDSLSEAEVAVTVRSADVAELPRTGLPLGGLAAVGVGLTAFGLWACRRAAARRYA